MRIQPRINGQAAPLDIEPQELLLDVLRDRLGLEEVEFVGKKSSDEVYQALRGAHIYFSTTMRFEYI